ncbi:hypothetical protein VU02_04695, partial [Desulfobulbus sp. N2]|nr:hypothetical protein [Desulfobulbus sp. N2]
MKKMIVAGAVLLLASSAQLSYAGNQKVEQEKAQEIEQTPQRNWALSGYIGMASFESEDRPDPYFPGVTPK